MMRIDQKNHIRWSVIILFIFAVLVGNFCVLYVHVRDNAISGRKQEVMRSAIEFNNFLVGISIMSILTESVGCPGMIMCRQRDPGIQRRRMQMGKLLLCRLMLTRKPEA